MTGENGHSADEFVLMLDRHVDGLSGEAEVDQLRELLASDDEARDVYFDYMFTESRLIRTFGPASTVAAESRLTEEEATNPPEDSTAKTQPRSLSLLQRASRHPFRPAIAVAVAVMLMILGAMAATPVTEWMAGNPKAQPEDSEPSEQPEFVAKLSNWHNDKWLEDTRPPLDDPRLKIGRRLKIESGLIEVTYLTGARVVIEGPAEFYVGRMKQQGTAAELARNEDGRGSSSKGGRLKKEEVARSSSPHPSSFIPHPSNAGFLRVGKLVARVEGEKAKGFSIDTPTASVEDFGTEFGVEVDRDGASEVVVLSGEIDLVQVGDDGAMGERVRLSKGEGASVTQKSRRIVRFAAPPKFVSKFVTTLPEAGTAGVVIDDFSDESLSSEYVQSTVEIAGSGGPNYIFKPADRRLTVTASGHGEFRQDALLRDDFSLDPGETLCTDVVSGTTRDATGMIITTTKNPRDRNNSIVVGFTGNTQTGFLWYFDNSGAPTFQTFSIIGTLKTLFIRRTARESYQLGYINESGQRFDVREVSTGGAENLDPGRAVGYLVDLRSDQTVVFDNLVIHNTLPQQETDEN